MAKNIQFDEILDELKLTQKESNRIQSIAVVGLGVMGQGIAHSIAAAEIDVTVIEKNEQQLQKQLQTLDDTLTYQINRWSMTKGEKRALLSRIHGTIDLNKAAKSSIIIEAVDEIFDLKQKLLIELDRICPKESIIVSNTASLSLTKLASMTKRADRIIGMHFLNPVPKVSLVEIVRGMKTSDETFTKVEQLASRLGKTPIEVFEYPGFVTTRVIIPFLNESMHVLMEGVATAESIDTAMRLGYNFQYGPLELADMMGLDEVLAWMESLFHELGEAKYRPCPLLRRMVREGKLGKKTGRGFFTYDEFGKRL